MKSAQILRKKINDRTLITGAICTFHVWPGLLEMSINAGLDYLILDLEHQTFSAPMIADICATARMLDYPVLVRPPQCDFTAMRLAMDMGPCGLLVPYVQTTDDMKTIRDAVYMPPRGKRRPGGMGNHWVTNYHYETFKKEVEDDVIILPQIESKLGLSNVEKIAADPLTTAIAVGPYDLSADLGVCWDPKSDVHRDAIAKIKAAGEAAGKNMWMIGDGAELAQRGFTFLCITEPASLLGGALKAEVKRATEQTAAAGVTLDNPLP